jgi:hypothetical protein
MPARVRAMVGLMTVALFGMIAAWQLAERAYVAGGVLAALALYRARALYGQITVEDDED